MEFTEAIRIALQSLWANKLRSILTLIGVVIGVASVIMVITLVSGANKFVATKVYGYGADVFTASKQPSVVFSDAEFTKYQKTQRSEDTTTMRSRGVYDDCARPGAMANTTGSVVYDTHSSTDIDIRGWTWICLPSTTSTSIAAAPSRPARRSTAAVSPDRSRHRRQPDGRSTTPGQGDPRRRRALHGHRRRRA